jgi:hypothetical protein
MTGLKLFADERMLTLNQNSPRTVSEHIARSERPCAFPS